MSTNYKKTHYTILIKINLGTEGALGFFSFTGLEVIRETEIETCVFLFFSL